MLSEAETVSRLVGGLNPLTIRAGRDLYKQPPGNKEKLQQLGLGDQQIRFPVRRWINEAFLEPANKRVLIASELKPTTTWTEFVKIAMGTDR